MTKYRVLLSADWEDYRMSATSEEEAKQKAIAQANKDGANWAAIDVREVQNDRKRHTR